MADYNEIHRNNLSEEEVAAVGLSGDLTADDSSARKHIPATLAKLRQMLTRAQEEESRELVSFADLLQIESKRTFDILVVGLAGAGKSTLVNTLLLEYVQEVSEGLCPDHTTKDLTFKEKLVTIGDKECELRIWDCPGMDGFDENDDGIIAQINARIEEPDLLIVCVDIAAFAGRRLKNALDYQVKKLMEVNDGKLFDHCAVAFTKANMVAEQYEKTHAKKHTGFLKSKPKSPEWHGQLKVDIAKCKECLQTALQEAHMKPETIENIPVCAFGEVEFSNKKPVGITSIGSLKKTWMRRNWSDLVNAGNDELIMLFFNVCNKFQMNDAVDPELRLLAPDGSSLRLRDPSRRYLACLALTLLGLTGVACAAAAPFTFGLSAVAALPLYVAAGAVVAGSGVGFTEAMMEQSEARKPGKNVAATFAKVPVKEALDRVAELEKKLGLV